MALLKGPSNAYSATEPLPAFTFSLHNYAHCPPMQAHASVPQHMSRLVVTVTGPLVGHMAPEIHAIQHLGLLATPLSKGSTAN